MGPNVLVTIRGRTSGLPRSTPLAIIEQGGRRWIWAPYGEVDWVRNLRAAGEATITAGRRTEEVTATELDPAERAAFFGDVLTPVARSMPLGLWFMRTLLGTDLRDPDAASAGPPGVRAASPPVTPMGSRLQAGRSRIRVCQNRP